MIQYQTVELVTQIGGGDCEKLVRRNCKQQVLRTEQVKRTGFRALKLLKKHYDCYMDMESKASFERTNKV